MAAIGSIPQSTPAPGSSPGPWPALVQPLNLQEGGSAFATLIVQSYLFMVFSRVTEYVGILTKVHIILIVAFMAGALAIMNGGLFRAASTKIGITLTAATGWMLLAAPFSTWVGGSVSGIANTWLKSFITFFIIAGLVTTFSQLRKLTATFAWATVVILVIVRFLSHLAVADDRIMVEGGTFGNSNDLATELLLGLPFCLLLVTDKARNILVRIFFGAVSLVLLGTVLKTGSRGALLTIVLLVAFVFWKSSTANKVKIAVVFLVAAGVVPFLLSRELKDRYLTIFMSDGLESSITDEADLANVHSALESTEARKMMLRHSMEIALQHPVFGVGYGQFPAADADRAIANGEEAYWHEVHNIFAILFVENGLPTVLLFLASFFFAFTTLLRIYNRARKDPAQVELARVSLCLLGSLTVFFVCNNFATAAYSMQYPILGGLCAALDIIVRRQPVAAAPPVTFAIAGPSRLPVKRPATPSWRF